MLVRLPKYFFFILATLALPAAALHASTDADDLRRAVLEADQTLKTEIPTRTVEVVYEAELSSWLRHRNNPTSALALELPAQPEPARVPEQPRKHVALFVNANGGGGDGTPANRIARAIIHSHNQSEASGRESDAHVPSAYLKYLSLRYHAGPRP